MQTCTVTAAQETIAPKLIKPQKKKKYKLQKRNDNTEIKEFVELIAASPDFANSCKQLYTFPDGETTPRRIGFFKQNRNDKLGLDHVNFRYFNKKHDYYITKNSFFAEQRGAAYLFSYDNIVIDIDKHDKRIAYKQLDHAIDTLIYLIENDYQGEIPEFNIVRSGRGVHLWVHLKSFSSKLGFLYESVCRELCNRIDRIIKENELPLVVDYTATTNASGFIRLPYTYNQKRKGYRAKFDKKTTQRYDINELIEEYSIPLISQHTVNKPQMVVLDSHYSGLNYKRMNFIERLVANCGGDCEGRREMMLYHYYNAAVQMYDRTTAETMMTELNKLFIEPLANKELKNIKKSVDKKGYYKYSNDKFLATLETSTNERYMYLNTNNRDREREKAREKKQKRNDQIVELAKQGYNQAKIAEMTGCNKSTVSRTLPDKKQARNEQIIKLREQGHSIREIAEKVKCSINTVQTVLKKNTTEQPSGRGNSPTQQSDGRSSSGRGNSPTQQSDGRSSSGRGRRRDRGKPPEKEVYAPNGEIKK